MIEGVNDEALPAMRSVEEFVSVIARSLHETERAAALKR